MSALDKAVSQSEADIVLASGRGMGWETGNLCAMARLLIGVGMVVLGVRWCYQGNIPPLPIACQFLDLSVVGVLLVLLFVLSLRAFGLVALGLRSNFEGGGGGREIGSGERLSTNQLTGFL